MAVPCCAIFDTTVGPECFMAPSAEQCRNIPGQVEPGTAKPGPEGAGCLEPCENEPCCWSCVPEFPEPPDLFPCCFPENQFRETFRSNCRRCGGEVDILEEECLTPPEPRDCRQAADDRAAESGRRWTIDLLGTVALGLDESVDADRGYARAIGANLTRHVALQPGDRTEPCAHLVADHFVLLDDGYAYAEFCSKPQWNRDDSRRRSYGVLRTAEAASDDQAAPLIRGYQYAIGSVHLPWWTEVIYRSHKVRCKGPER